ncbi:MAG: dipeptide epimerase [Pseudomonadota bacterium]
MSRRWSVELERWPYQRPFIIARGTFTHALNLVVTLQEGPWIGRGECEAHEYDQDRANGLRDRARAFLEAHAPALDRDRLATLLEAGPLRNAIDCALWDLEAKRSQVSVAARLGPLHLTRLPITGTVSLDEPAVMAAQAQSLVASASVLKLKLGTTATQDRDRLAAVRTACPDHELIVDANGGWTADDFARMVPALADSRVRLIEQPLAPGRDTNLLDVASPIPLCADEGLTDRHSLAVLPPGYSVINIKLDKCGGLTEALALTEDAKARGIDYMVGSNGGTSLAAAPAFWLGAEARVVDIDSPTMLASDRPAAMRFSDGWVFAPTTELWG